MIPTPCPPHPDPNPNINEPPPLQTFPFLSHQVRVLQLHVLRLETESSHLRLKSLNECLRVCEHV